MKICTACKEYHTEIIEKENSEIEECSVEKCEIGHPKMKPQLPKTLIELTDQLKAETAQLKIRTAQLKVEITLNMDPQWGWAYIAPSHSVHYWWLWGDDKAECDYCDTKRPDDSKACDIHYEPWMWIEDIGAWIGGLLNFGGSRPAENCGGDGGVVNSRRDGVCLRKYADAPEVWGDRWLWARFASTYVTDCIFRNQYIILDYIPTESGYNWIEKIRRILRIS
jgi:hypothetical protein